MATTPSAQLAVANTSVSGESRGYAYDAAWNLHYRTNNATVGTFLVDGKNQLTNAPSYNLSYDGNGNPTGPVYAGASTTLAYGDENRLISFSTGGNTSTFAYDGLGRLRTRSDPSGVVNYIYDGMRVIQERDGSNGPQVSYTRGLDLSGTFEGAGGIGGLLARSHDFTLCTNMLTVRVTNGSPYLLEVWLYHSDTAVDYNPGGNWWLVPDLANAVVYAEAVQVPPDDYRDFTFEAVGGREYDLYGHGDYYYVQEFYVPITATLENYQVGLVPLGNDLDWSYGESGNVLCGEDLTGRWLTHTYYHADGNGNITCLVNANQTVVASYRYDPYGNTLAQSGPLAEANTYRFSSKEFHAASGLYYYGYRFYDPRMQRWPNRDPLGERGGINLYAYVLNNPVNAIDPYGLWSFYKWLYTGDGNISDEIYDEALDAAADYTDCYSKCMADVNKKGLALAAGAVGASPIPKPYLGVWPEPNQSMFTGKARLASMASRYVSGNSAVTKALHKEALNVKAAPLRAAVRGGVAGVCIAETAAAGYCAKKCSGSE